MEAWKGSVRIALQQVQEVLSEGSCGEGREQLGLRKTSRSTQVIPQTLTPTMNPRLSRTPQGQPRCPRSPVLGDKKSPLKKN